MSSKNLFLLGAFLLGVFGGLGVYTLNYAGAAAYLSDDPAACTNCHVMRDQFEAWSHSSHKAFAACNDCHTPDGFASKWITKGINGWNHSVAFTTGNFPDPIRINAMNAGIVQANCVACHASLVREIHRTPETEARSCVECHGNVGHRRW